MYINYHGIFRKFQKHFCVFLNTLIVWIFLCRGFGQDLAEVIMTMVSNASVILQKARQQAPPGGAPGAPGLPQQPGGPQQPSGGPGPPVSSANPLLGAGGPTVPPSGPGGPTAPNAMPPISAPSLGNVSELPIGGYRVDYF